jgi:hypothetical protein
MTGGGADASGFGQFGIGQPPVILQQTQYLKIDAVKPARHERKSRQMVYFWMKEYNNNAYVQNLYHMYQ